MKDTASIRIYQILDSISMEQLIMDLTKLHGYHEVQIDENVQSVNDIKVRAVIRENFKEPDWVNLIKSYILSHEFNQFRHYDLAVFFSLESENQTHTFAFCGGSGIHHIMSSINRTFGISVLESMFDPSVNKIYSISEKGIIGDILASRRFYRKARSVAYEDDFGVYFQNIITRISSSQVHQYLPSLARFKGEKLSDSVSVSGSSSIEIQMQLSFIVLINLIKDILKLLLIEPPKVFNKYLLPLNNKHDNETINQISKVLLANITEFCLDPKNHYMDFDFCYHDFEAFFTSKSCTFSFPLLRNINGDEISPIIVEDIYALNNPFVIRDILKSIELSLEYKKASDKREFYLNTLNDIQIMTSDDSGHTPTSGNLIDYLQLELTKDNISYFLLDKVWYKLQGQFDESLLEKYKIRLSDRVYTHPFIKSWVGSDETDYNKQYNEQPNSFYFHLIKVNNVELCDALVMDKRNRRTYILHVKDGLGANIRDLTSQVHIAARIIEEESRGELKKQLNKLFEQGVENKRIDEKLISREDFLDLFSYYREYVLCIHAKNVNSLNIKQGNFKSRIAKYSLVEFASTMRIDGYNFMISCIPD